MIGTPKRKNKQLDLSDRLFIEDRIELRDSFSEIARRLGASPSTPLNTGEAHDGGERGTFNG